MSTFAGRIRQLAEGYATPVPDLVSEVEALASKVAGHLGRMGFCADGELKMESGE